jgi:hypothetical protein
MRVIFGHLCTMAEALLANLVVDGKGIHRRRVRAAERMQPQPDRTLFTSFSLFGGSILTNILPRSFGSIFGIWTRLSGVFSLRWSTLRASRSFLHVVFDAFREKQPWMP